ncbi:hypothetical protein DOM21_12165 [Bacteriovorax stolpii]|uniref:Uncharacterized protein n=1 Tax=Bacteriovorax stolpii TaxID=960 RepID=A0A2K9NQP2_BACTC|nr:thrombospondin type-1 domain-containing protein [Bacteriovorax stolpii]AUN97828.1 hypothetical protein C0V70_06835 [Bacteriovorax stolpii]QDK42186.1 hypothetical protein DOM21_12165 [Bacteriovorax stolpii]TDP51655.1 hypothetical protein C8D79_3099 [Bacteriovorax stolpii]
MKILLGVVIYILSQSAFGWTDDPIIPKVTPIKKIHIQEIRQAIEALVCPAWEVSEWSVCSGGSGQWIYAPWSVCTGGTSYLTYSPWGACSASCAGGTQNRTATCLFSTNSGTQTRNAQCTFNALSGTQNRTVQCRVDGVVVDDSLCASAPKPLALQACTPNNPALCGTIGATTQNCTPTGPAVCSTPVTTQSCNTQSCCTDTAMTPYRTERNCRTEASTFFACTFKYCDGEFVYPYYNSCTGYRSDVLPYTDTYVGCF